VNDQDRRGATKARILIFILGLYLACSAAYTYGTASWFAGFPPALDVFEILSKGKYIEAAVAALLGLVLMAASFWRRKATR
jgi:hypothetical protein